MAKPRSPYSPTSGYMGLATSGRPIPTRAKPPRGPVYAPENPQPVWSYPQQGTTPTPPSGPGGDQTGGTTTTTRAAPPRPTWDPDSDPMVKAARAQAAQQEQLAKAKRYGLQKQELIGFGSQALARSILGDDAIINTISDDPGRSFSFMANLRRAYGQPIGSHEDWLGGVRQGKIPEFEEGLLPENLWFSSHHADQLRALEQAKLGEQDVQQRQVQANLATYQQNYLDVANQAKWAIQNAILQRQQAFQDRLDQWSQMWG
jgi:hypothetical protein